MPIPTVDIMPVLPQVIVAVAALLLLLLDLVLPSDRTEILAALTLLALGASAAAALYIWGASGTAYSGMIASDNLSLFFCLVLLTGGALTVLLSWDYLKREEIGRGEFYPLVLLALAGMMLLVASNDLLMIFLALETLSLALYILVGFARDRLSSEEAALKYFLLGAFASAFLLYGIALIYGATGTTRLSSLGGFVSTIELRENYLLIGGLVLLMVGFAFKLALVPFQMWTPDVYQGAPTPVTAFMSVATKAAGFAALMRVVAYALPSLSADWMPMLAVLAILSMTVGNLAALAQRNIKRMLAYSSIAHAGYILIGIVAGNELGQSSVLFYLATYTFASVGAFAVVQALERREEGLAIGDYAGLARRAPGLSAVMALFMFSLAGFPPTAGFIAKFYVFSAAVEAGFVGLAIIGVLNSLVGVAYYVGVVVNMYMREPGKSMAPLHVTLSLVISVAIAAWGVVGFGLLPSPLLELARQSLALVR